MATRIRDFDINGTAAEIETSQPCEYVTASATTSETINPNVLYVFQGAITDLTISLNAPADTDIVNEYHFIFKTNTGATINWPTDVAGFAGGTAPTLQDNTTYEVSIVEGMAIVIEF